MSGVKLTCYDLYTSNRYQGRSWNEVEPEVRKDFERRYPTRDWEQFKEAIHHGYSIPKQQH